MPDLCRIDLLGGLRVHTGGAPLTKFGKKNGPLLAYLAFHRDEARSREELSMRFWADASNRRNSLTKALGDLQGRLTALGFSPEEVLQSDPDYMWLNPDHGVVTTDVIEFKRFIHAAEKAKSSLERCEDLKEAVDLYSGVLLPDFDDEEVNHERSTLARQHMETLTRLVDEFEVLGESNQALGYAERMLKVDPLDEIANLRLMRLYVKLDQLDRALRLYRSLEKLLKEGEDEPGSDLKDFFLEIRSSRKAPLIPVTPPSPKLALNGPDPPGTTYTTVTFLAVDLVSKSGPGPQPASTYLATFSEFLQKTFEEHGGKCIQAGGGFFLVAFAAAGQALNCALAGQGGLETISGEGGIRIGARMALSTLDASGDGGQFEGSVMDDVKRMASGAHEGQIVCSETTAVLLRRNPLPHVSVVELKLYRLRRETPPEPIFQVAHPSLRSGFPPLGLEQGYQSRLPAPRTRFYGRTQEIERLEQILSDGETRLVTLVGPGGSGKSRLSMEVARRLFDSFSGAVWFVPLANVSEPNDIPSAIGEVIGLPRLPHVEPLTQVVGVLNRQRSLLILDNYEHLVEFGAQTIDDLLDQVPLLTCLVTSRKVLALAGEYQLQIAPLPTPHGPNKPEVLSLYDSVRLFVDRAQAARPSFHVNDKNAPAVAELCRKLEGLPLAIELAAARIHTYSPNRMLELMSDRFSWIETHSDRIEERHRSLWNTIDWSYRLLREDLQGLLTCLAVFRGGWTLEAAQEVCGSSDKMLENLETFRSNSLVTVDPDANATGTSARYSMLESVREYAVKAMPQDELQTLERNHATFFLQVAKMAWSTLRGHAQGPTLMALEADHDNLRAGLRWSKENDAELGLRLAISLAYFWEINGHWREGYRWFTELLERASNDDRLLRGKALLCAGNLARILGNELAAQNALLQSEALVLETGDSRTLAQIYNGLGISAQEKGDYTEARRYLNLSLRCKREINDLPGQGASLANLGFCAYLLNDTPAARRDLDEAIDTLRKVGDLRVLANALNNLGGTVRLGGDCVKARTHLAESLKIRVQLSDRKNLSYSFDEFARLAAAEADWVTAAQLSGQAEALRRSMSFVLCSPEQTRWADFVQLVRSQMIEARFRNDWRRGWSMSLDQACSLALQDAPLD